MFRIETSFAPPSETRYLRVHRFVGPTLQSPTPSSVPFLSRDRMPFAYTVCTPTCGKRATLHVSSEESLMVFAEAWAQDNRAASASLLTRSPWPQQPSTGLHHEPGYTTLPRCTHMSLILQFGTRVLGACRRTQSMFPASAWTHTCPRGGRHLEGLHCIAMPLRVARPLRFHYTLRRRHQETQPTHPSSITTGSLAMGSDNDLRTSPCGLDRLHGEVARLGIRMDSDRNHCALTRVL